MYPDRHNLMRSINLGEFTSLEDCRAAALDALERYPDGDYECGKNCREHSRGLYVCDDTVR